MPKKTLERSLEQAQFGLASARYLGQAGVDPAIYEDSIKTLKNTTDFIKTPKNTIVSIKTPQNTTHPIKMP